VSDRVHDPFHLTAHALQRLLSPKAPSFPELDAARGNLESLRAAPQTRVVLAQTQQLMATIERLPQTSYTLYRRFVHNGDRGRFVYTFNIRIYSNHQFPE
jgi:hypothetical protein